MYCLTLAQLGILVQYVVYKSVCSMLQCDECQLWAHASCVHITDDLYRELQVTAQFSWHYPLCLFAVLLTTEVIDCSTQSPFKSCTVLCCVCICILIVYICMCRSSVEEQFLPSTGV